MADLIESFNERYQAVFFKASERAYLQPELFASEQHRETMAIFYDKTRFKLLDHGRFWLAPDENHEPTIPAWDGSIFSRVAVYAKFYDNRTGHSFLVLTAHFDHVGKEARKNSAHLIMNKAQELGGSIPLFVMGDFNTFQNDGGPEVYEAFASHFDLFSDVRDAAEHHYGIVSTWVGWEYNAFREEIMETLCPGKPSRWDHLFVTRSNVRVLRTAVPDDRYKISWKDKEKIVYPSDHRPILADCILQSSCRGNSPNTALQMIVR